MKLTIVYDSDRDEYSFSPLARTFLIDGEDWYSNLYEIPQALAEKWLTAQAVWDEIQVEADKWVLEHPNSLDEPEPEVAETEPILTWDYSE